MSWEHAQMALALVGGKWTLSILGRLRDRPWRVMELRSSLDGPSMKVLQDSLRQLEDRDVIMRQVIPTSPPGVQYRLTTRGQALVSILDELEAGIARTALPERRKSTDRNQ